MQRFPDSPAEDHTVFTDNAFMKLPMNILGFG
jgi:hypothetical protein